MNIVLLVIHIFLVVWDVRLAITNWNDGNKISSILWGIAGFIWFVLLIMDIFKTSRGV